MACKTFGVSAKMAARPERGCQNEGDGAATRPEQVGALSRAILGIEPRQGGGEF
jgi:hypothetical protein